MTSLPRSPIEAALLEALRTPGKLSPAQRHDLEQARTRSPAENLKLLDELYARAVQLNDGKKPITQKKGSRFLL